MSDPDRPPPAFDAPPVVETAVGVEFAPIESWDVPHFGLFWQGIRGRYPNQRTQYLPHQLGTIPAALPPGPNIRCQFLTADETQLIQVQRDRLFHNWQHLRPDDAYPHYKTIRPAFLDDWQRFLSFVQSEGLEQPDIRVCEVTYVNHIERGQGWDSMADLPQVIKSVCLSPDSLTLSIPRAIVSETTYLLGDGEGDLNVSIYPAYRHRDAAEVLQLTFVAHLRPASSAEEDIVAALDRGHDLIVESFAQITTDRMHQRWRRRV